MAPDKVALTAIAVIAFAGVSQGQNVTRYVDGTTRKEQAVDPQHRLPVAGGANSDPAGGLDTKTADNLSSGVALSSPGTFYSIVGTVIAGQGPGFLMVFDSPTVPADGPVSAMRCLYLPAGPLTGAVSSAISIGARRGLTWAFSNGPNCQTKQEVTINQVSMTFKQAPTSAAGQ